MSYYVPKEPNNNIYAILILVVFIILFKLIAGG
jgi:hypothetical protein